MAYRQNEAMQATEPLALRPLQKDIREDSARFKVVCIHRRFGKTVLVADWLLDIVKTPLPSPRAYFVFPFANQAEEVTWQFLLNQIPDKDAVLETSRTKKSVQFKPREGFDEAVGPMIQLLGAERYYKHRGKYADRVAFDELPDIPPPAWTQIFRPMLSERKGKAMFIGTSRGRDWFHDLWHKAQTLPGWKAWHATVYETGVLDDEEIEALRRELDDWEFRQEYLCDWDLAVNGAYYQKALNSMIADGRVCEVPHAPDLPVSTAWWLDDANSISVTWWQQRGLMQHCIAAERFLDGSITEVCGDVLGRGYIYDRHHAPANLPINSPRWRAARQLGVRLTPVLAQEHMGTVELVRSRMASMRMDEERASLLVEAGRQFHAAYDPATKSFGQRPVRNWAHDLAGSLGVFATGHNPNRSDWSKPVQYPNAWRAGQRG